MPIRALQEKHKMHVNVCLEIPVSLEEPERSALGEQRRLTCNLKDTRELRMAKSAPHQWFPSVVPEQLTSTPRKLSSANSQPHSQASLVRTSSSGTPKYFLAHNSGDSYEQ